MKTVKKVGPPTGGFGVKMVKKVGPPLGVFEGVWGENSKKGSTPLQAVLKVFGVKTV